MMKIFNINIDKYNVESQENLIDINFWSRKIILDLMKSRNEIFSETSKIPKFLCVGIELYSILQSSISYSYTPILLKTGLNNIEYVGAICGMDLFVIRHTYLKPFQYIYFNNIQTIISDIRRIYRNKKLERILN